MLRAMKVISVMGGDDFIMKILKHLGLKGPKARTPPEGRCVNETIIDYSESQIPSSDDYLESIQSSVTENLR
jgi:hypothetical protein